MRNGGYRCGIKAVLAHFKNDLSCGIRFTFFLSIFPAFLHAFP
jgi:hypothetical protein